MLKENAQIATCQIAHKNLSKSGIWLPFFLCLRRLGNEIERVKREDASRLQEALAGEGGVVGEMFGGPTPTWGTF